jgi:hypothetical protein
MGSITLAHVRRIMLALPEVDEGPCYGTPGFRVHRKFLARLREDGATLAVKCGHEARDAWLRAKPASFFITEHYRGSPAVVVNLATVELADLRAVLEQAWRRSAPKRVIAAYDAERLSTPTTESTATADQSVSAAIQRDQVKSVGKRPTRN